MKTKSKALLMTLCAVLLVAASVLGTMAYLTSTPGAVTNTFSIGKIDITLDEAKVDEYGVAVTPATRVTGNAYKLVPGHTYTKDPTVHVTDKNSEDSWIFVKVENGIAAYEADTKIAKQITDNGWTKLTGVDGVDNVYYREYDKDSAVKNFVVFDSFTIAQNAETIDGWANATSANITITAYAIQKDANLTTANAAWTAGSFN